MGWRGMGLMEKAEIERGEEVHNSEATSEAFGKL